MPPPAAQQEQCGTAEQCRRLPSQFRAEAAYLLVESKRTRPSDLHNVRSAPLVAPSSRHCPSSSLARRSGPTSSPPPGCRWPTTSSRRPAPPSPSPRAGQVGRRPRRVPLKRIMQLNVGTSAATWISSTCSSESSWSRGGSPRPRPSPRRSNGTWVARDVPIGPPDYVAWLNEGEWRVPHLDRFFFLHDG